MECLKKSNTFWLASALVEAGAGRALVAACMPSKLGNDSLFIEVSKWLGLLFTSGFLHSLIQVKVKQVCLSEWTLHLEKIYSSHFYSFRILKALIILFLLFACMNYVQNQNGKILEEKCSQVPIQMLWKQRW